MIQHDRTEKRTIDCISVEMRFDGESFHGCKEYNKDFNVHYSEFMGSTDEEWDKIITGLREELQRRKNNR